MSGGCHLRKTASYGGPALGLRSPSTVRNDSSDTWRVGQPGTVVPVASRSTATSAWFRGLDAAGGELLMVASRVSRSPCRGPSCGRRARRRAGRGLQRRGSDRSPGEPLLYPSPTTRRPRSLAGPCGPLRADTEDAMAVTASGIRCLIFQREKRQKGGRTRLQGTHRGLRPSQSWSNCTFVHARHGLSVAPPGIDIGLNERYSHLVFCLVAISPRRSQPR